MKKDIEKIPFANHEEWLSIRSNYIGGSDAGTCVGLNDYNSAFKLWAEKTGKVEPFQGNTTTEVGSYLEEFVAQQFVKQTGKKVKKSNFTYVNKRFPWACANVDRLVVGEDAILEIKTTTNPKYIKVIEEGHIVPAWWAQIVHYMTVLEKPKAYLAVLLDCREVKVMEFDFDEAESLALMDAELAFAECVKTDTPPNVDASKHTSNTLSAIYPISADETTADLASLEDVLEEYDALTKQIDELEAEKDLRVNQIKEFMKDSEKGESFGYKVSWKTSTSERFDTKKFKEANKDLDLSNYMKTTTSRTFRVKAK